MNNEEKMLTVEDAYDAMVDYLEKIYRKTNLDYVGSLLGGMAILEDGKPADSGILGDWNKAINKILNQNHNIRKHFELCGKKLSLLQAYSAMINFLEIYNYDEIVILLRGMRLTSDGKTIDPNVWESWIESVDKILSKNPKIRPLFLLLNSKALTIDDAYDTTVDYLNAYYNRSKANDIKTLLKNMKRLENGELTNLAIQYDWNKAVEIILKQNIHNNKDPQIPENGLSATEGYNAVINFLNTYNHKINSNEIVTLLNEMKLLNELESTNPEAWHSWMESVNKTLNKYREF